LFEVFKNPMISDVAGRTGTRWRRVHRGYIPKPLWEAHMMAANRFRRLDTTLSWIAEPIRQQRSQGTERGMPARSQNRLKTKLFPANSLGKRDLADNDELFPKAPTRHEPREPKGPGTRLCVISLRPNWADDREDERMIMGKRVGLRASNRRAVSTMDVVFSQLLLQ
jgi:hypothetical protein